MGLFMPRESEINSQDFQPLGPPIRETPKPVVPPPAAIYQKVGTQGVVVNTQTGKMETQIPGNKMADPPGTIVMDDIQSHEDQVKHWQQYFTRK